MRRALVHDFGTLERTRVVFTLDSRFSEGPGPGTVVRVSQEEELSTFSRLAAEADLTLLVAPETDGILQERARMITQVQGRSLGSTVEAISLAGDKHALADHWKRFEVATPAARVVRPLEGLPRDQNYPAILKPRFGAGCLETYFVESFDACPSEALSMSEAILQEYILGESLSASFLVGADGRSDLIGVATQTIDREGLRLVYRGGSLPILDEIEGISIVRRAVECVPGLRGWVGVDFIVDCRSGDVIVLEINPRVTTSLVGWRRLLGPGRIAEQWMGIFKGDKFQTDVGRREFDKIIDFDADGTIREGHKC